ncbi:MAG: hypothetical protein E7397_00940 [Ruminococcaceae bacterium]|nr:hypothetical protein [Oscillospiraceae bacterium]
MAGVVVLPEKVLKKLNTYLLPQWKVCFFASLLVGLVAHLYKITSWLPNWDSLVFRYDSQNMIALGRWFLPVACSFSSFYDLPFLNGILAIVFHALGAVCICKILKVQKKITAGLIGAVIVSFPTVTSVLMYNYVADGYAISFFLATLAALLLTKEKPKYLLSAVLIALSTGIYQAYITVTVMLVLLRLIDEIVFGNTSFRLVLTKALRILLSGVLGMAFYAITLKAMLGICSVELLDYQGINSSASLSGIDLFASLYVVKQSFLKCFFDLSGGINVSVVLNGILLILTLFCYIRQIITKKLYQQPAKLLLLAVFGVLSILGSAALAFINAEIDYHNLMLMGYCVFYLFFLLLYERGTEKFAELRCWTVLITATILVANQVVISNVSYHKAQMAYEKSYGVLLRIADRMEQTPGQEQCNRLLVIGALKNSEAYSVTLPPVITGITDGYILRADDETVGQSVLCSALNDYCDKNYEFISGEEKKAFLQTEEVKAMNTWPQDGCIKTIEDTIIIKLGTEGEK